MLDNEVVAAFNARQRVDVNNIKKMTPAQRDGVKVWGSNAENLLKNRELAQMIHEYKFALCDALTDIRDHTEEANVRRVAVANQLAGIDDFISSLKRAVYIKNKVVSLDEPSPADTI